jgi:hypothetical protein
MNIESHDVTSYDDVNPILPKCTLHIKKVSILCCVPYIIMINT